MCTCQPHARTRSVSYLRKSTEGDRTHLVDEPKRPGTTDDEHVSKCSCSKPAAHAQARQALLLDPPVVWQRPQLPAPRLPDPSHPARRSWVGSQRFHRVGLAEAQHHPRGASRAAHTPMEQRARVVGQPQVVADTVQHVYWGNPFVDQGFRLHRWQARTGNTLVETLVVVASAELRGLLPWSQCKLGSIVQPHGLQAQCARRTESAVEQKDAQAASSRESAPPANRTVYTVSVSKGCAAHHKRYPPGLSLLVGTRRCNPLLTLM